MLNTAARIPTRANKCDHITPVLASLHWLPVKARADFKIILLTYTALHALAPTHLSDLVLPYIPTRTLWSQYAGLLIVPRISKQTAEGRAFSYWTRFLWNGLPIHVRDADSVSTFKSLLKTHLFTRSYDWVQRWTARHWNDVPPLLSMTWPAPIFPLGFSASDPIIGACALRDIFVGYTHPCLRVVSWSVAIPLVVMGAVLSQNGWGMCRGARFSLSYLIHGICINRLRQDAYISF